MHLSKTAEQVRKEQEAALAALTRKLEAAKGARWVGRLWCTTANVACRMGGAMVSIAKVELHDKAISMFRTTCYVQSRCTCGTAMHGGSPALT